MPDSKIRGNKEARYDTTPRANDLPHRERKRIETEITQIRPDPGSGINLIMSIRDPNIKNIIVLIEKHPNFPNYRTPRK